MKTSTIAVIALVAVLYFTMNQQRPVASVPTLPPPQLGANNQGSTFADIMAMIRNGTDIIRQELDSSSQRA